MSNYDGVFEITLPDGSTVILQDSEARDRYGCRWCDILSGLDDEITAINIG